MNLRELASPRLYAWLMAGFDLGRLGAATRQPPVQPAGPELHDDFEETRPCSWYVNTPEDQPDAPG